MAAGTAMGTVQGTCLACTCVCMSVSESVYVCGSLYERMCVCVYAHVHKHHDLARGAGRVGIRIGKGFPGEERSKTGRGVLST